MSRQSKGSRKPSPRKPGSRGGDFGASPSLWRRATRGLGLLVLLVAMGALGLAGWLFFRSPKDGPNLRAAAHGVSETAGALYEKLPDSKEDWKNLAHIDALTGSDGDGDANLPGQLEIPIVIARVTRVIDGETLLVRSAGKDERVRLLKIDTPESKSGRDAVRAAFADRAADYARRRLEGRQVRLQFESKSSQRGPDGALLCYVLVDDSVFNLELVEQGLSPYAAREGKSAQFDSEFRKAEASAREQRAGLWGNADLAKEYADLR